MHICDDNIKAYYNIEKRKLVKTGIEIYRGDRNSKGGQKFIGGDRNGPIPTYARTTGVLCNAQKHTSTCIGNFVNQWRS